MRQVLILIISMFSTITYAQINGNGKFETRTINLNGLKEIDIQLNADITLDYNAEETMTITADENVIDFIGQTFKGGKLTLDQVKWIEPSKNPKITIGSPNLIKIFQGTHSSTSIINLNTQKIWVGGNVGKVYVSGSCKEIRVDVTGADVDLRNTEIGYADITIDGSATVTLNKVNKLDTNLGRNANIILLKEPKQYLGNSEEEIKVKASNANLNLNFVSFKIKNNSWSRNHFFVVGPKKNGETFSYGFPMMPGSSKSEKWSVGTKIYKEGKLGSRELLVIITKDDEGQVVKLF